MNVVKERAASAAYDLGMRPRAPLPDAEPQRRVRGARPVDTRPLPGQPGKMADASLQLNQQLSSVQSAHRYLTQVTEHLLGFKRDLGRSLQGASAGAASAESISRSVTRLNDLLDNRSRLSGASLDAQLSLSLDEPLRSRFVIKGLESLPAVQASGSETLLFNAGRTLSGPIAVVLDDNMSDGQLLRRFNISLAQVGLHAEVNDASQLHFSASESQWQKLKGQMSVQGEDKLFDKGRFSPLQIREENLLGAPLEVPQSGRAPLRQLFDTVDHGLRRINGVVEQLNVRQARARDQLGRQESPEEKRWAHDFAGRVFDTDGRHGAGFSRVAQVVLSQANLSRHRVSGLLG